MSGRSRGKFSDADPKLAVAFLRSEHPFKTAMAVEAETGIPADTVRKWFEGSRPSYLHVLRLIHRYGPAFLMAVMPDSPTWLDEMAGWTRQKELEASIAAQSAELARLREERL